MIQTNMVAYSVDELTAGIRLILIDEDEIGIKMVRVLDRFGFEILKEEYPNCEFSLDIDLGVIEHSRFPISVEATDCADKTTPPVLLNFAPPGSPDGPMPRLPCGPTFCAPNSACDEAAGIALNARNTILQLCDQLRALRQERNTWASVAATAFVAAAAFAAAAISAAAAGGLFGIIAAIVLALAAAIALGIGIAATIKARNIQARIDRLETDMQNARNRFSEAASRVNEVCCPGCFDVDLNQPEC